MKARGVPLVSANVRLGELNERQQQAIEALLTADSKADVAAQVGVTDRTIRRWLAEPTFRTALGAARRSALELALCDLSRVARQAARTLARRLRSQDESVQIRAADRLLSHLVKLREVLDVEAELQALGERMNRIEKTHRGPAWRG